MQETERPDIAERRREQVAQARLDAELGQFCREMAAEVTSHSSTDQADADFWKGLAIHMKRTGRPTFLPNKPGSMRDLNRLTRGIDLAQRAQAVVVGELREEGVPWERIGQSTGMTGEGARRRWGT